MNRKRSSLKTSTVIMLRRCPEDVWASLVAQMAKNPPTMQETWVRSLGWEDPLEKGKATHYSKGSSILVWRIPWTILSQRVRHN